MDSEYKHLPSWFFDKHLTVVEISEFEEVIRTSIKARFESHNMNLPIISDGYKLLTEKEFIDITVDDVDSFLSKHDMRPSTTARDILDLLLYPLDVVSDYPVNRDLSNLKHSRMLVSEEVFLRLNRSDCSTTILRIKIYFYRCIHYFFVTGNQNVYNELCSMLTNDEITKYGTFFTYALFLSTIQPREFKLVLPFVVIRDFVQGVQTVRFEPFRTFVDEHTDIKDYDASTVNQKLDGVVEHILKWDGQDENIKIIRFLVSKGLDVNSMEAFMPCLRQNSIEYLSVFIELGMNIKELSLEDPDYFFRSVFLYAKPEIFKFMIDSGMCVNFPYRQIPDREERYEKINIAVNNGADPLAILNII